MNCLKSISNSVFYCVWSVIAFILLMLAMVLAVMVDLTMSTINFFKKLFTKDHQHN